MFSNRDFVVLISVLSLIILQCHCDNNNNKEILSKAPTCAVMSLKGLCNESACGFCLYNNVCILENPCKTKNNLTDGCPSQWLASPSCEKDTKSVSSTILIWLFYIMLIFLCVIVGIALIYQCAHSRRNGAYAPYNAL